LAPLAPEANMEREASRGPMGQRACQVTLEDQARRVLMDPEGILEIQGTRDHRDPPDQMQWTQMEV
jgi:hypothetical protein